MPHRRDFLRLFAFAGLSALPSVRLKADTTGAAQTRGPLFEEIPSSVSGITWVHDNAMSDNRYLPETMGPGVAFFDFDNDGGMDIFLVNSVKRDFYTPAA